MAKVFNNDEIALVLEALQMAASRHESEARFNIGKPRGTSLAHDNKAAAMRKLSKRIKEQYYAQATAPAP